MAGSNQVGERCKVKKDSGVCCGKGVASEALTCNALEWQLASDGGGGDHEEDKTISVE